MKIRENAKYIREVLDVPMHDVEHLITINEIANKKPTGFGWMIQRILVDEQLQPQSKMYGLFMLGRMYEQYLRMEGDLNA